MPKINLFPGLCIDNQAYSPEIARDYTSCSYSSFRLTNQNNHVHHHTAKNLVCTAWKKCTETLPL